VKIQELHALIRTEIHRMVEAAECAPTTLTETSELSSMPGAPAVEVLKAADEKSKKYALLWYRLVKVCQQKFGPDCSAWPEKAIKACMLLGQKVSGPTV
jgi:hypothetical protein